MLLKRKKIPYLETIVALYVEQTGCTEEEAKDALSSEIGNYKVKTKNDKAFLEMWHHYRDFPNIYASQILPTENNRCEANLVTTKNYLRCKSSASFTMGGKRYCGNHKQYLQNKPNPKPLDKQAVIYTTEYIKSLLEEKDIEKLRCLAIVVKKNLP